jgi:poly(hydroxyalkanoate) granule-associated protein
MTFKKKAEKQGGSWIDEIENYSRQIWLAGLGAYSKISKDGTKLFDNLVRDGEKAEKAATTDADPQAAEGAGAGKDKSATGRSRVDLILDKAAGKWGALEEAFDKRLSNAIVRLGLPSRAEVEALSGEVEQLRQQLQALSQAAGPAKTASRSSSAKAKPRTKAASAEGKPTAARTRQPTEKTTRSAGKRAAVKQAPAVDPVAPASAHKSEA